MSRKKKLPIYTGPILKPTLAEIEAGRTPAGGFSRYTLASWGVAWPPPTGWRVALELQVGHVREEVPTNYDPARKLIVVFADASFKNGVGGYGVWIKHEDDKPGATFGGPLEGVIASSNEAEVKGIAMAIYLGLKHNLIQQGDAIMVQCDNTHALALLRYSCGAQDRPAVNGHRVGMPKRLRGGNKEMVALNYIADAKRKNDLTLLVRHVKGHKSGDGRQYVNKLCDRLARDGRKRREAEIAFKPTTGDHHA